jgi:exonuclease III
VRLDNLLVPGAVIDRVVACAPATDVRIAPLASDHLPLVADLEAP